MTSIALILLSDGILEIKRYYFNLFGLADCFAYLERIFRLIFIKYYYQLASEHVGAKAFRLVDPLLS